MKTIDIILPVKDRFENLIEKINTFDSIYKSGQVDIKKNKLILNIVSDGNDNTYVQNITSYIDSLNNDKIVLHILENNSGPGAARNYGIKNSSCSIISFIDSDDVLDARYFVDLLRHINEDNVDKFSYLDFDDSTQFIDTVINNFNHKIAIYLNLIPPDPPRFVVERSYLSEHQIEFGDYLHEDLIFAFKIALYSNQFRRVKITGYNKLLARDSITQSISKKHIYGYLKAYDEITSIADASVVIGEKWAGYAYAIARTVKEITKKGDDKKNLLTFLNTRVGNDIKLCIKEWLAGSRKPPKWFPKHFGDTTYHKILIGYFENSEVDNLTKLSALRVGCKDLEGSIFIAPKEIRTCCKRFFRNGIRQGDVKVLDLGECPNTTAIPDLVVRKKYEILNKINLGISDECGGCPNLSSKPRIDLKTINYLSLEDHTVCNMRCSYCDETYYGGEKSNGRIAELVRELRMQLNFSPEVVVWGGGEPTISSDFYVISKELAKLDSVSSLRVLTNALKFSSTLGKLLVKIKNSQIITSIDAGTEKTFQIVRGVRTGAYLHRVMENLAHYNAVAPGRVTIKYIFTDENYKIDEIESFIRLCSSYNMSEFTLQISNDFKKSSIDLARLKSIIHMFYAAREFFDGRVVIDEIVRRRIDYKDVRISDFLERNIVSDKYGKEPTVIVGTGEMLDLVRHTKSVSQRKNFHIVDLNTSKNFSQFFPGMHTSEPAHIFIAAVQGFTLIKKEIESNFGTKVNLSKALLL